MEIFGSTAWCSGEMVGDAHCINTVGYDPSTATQKWVRTNMDDAWDSKELKSHNVEVSLRPSSFVPGPLPP
jgi:hypothetical protein